MAVTAAKKYTLDEYAQLPDDGTRRELDEGELVMMTFPKSRHSFAASNLYDSLNPWVRERELGRCFMDAGFLLQVAPPILRGPDVAFVRAGRLLGIDLDRWIHGGPDLAVEIVSPSERVRDVEKKVRQYLSYGSAVVLTIEPLQQEVRIHRADGSIAFVSAPDTLEIPDLFPGWSMPVAELF